MKLARFSFEGKAEVYNGVIEGDFIHTYSGSPFEQIEILQEKYALHEVKLLSPIIPRHIIGIGKNFVAEGSIKPPMPELPIFFFKPITTVIGPDDPILFPSSVTEAKFEAEVAIVIGKTAQAITPDEASNYILGSTIANDVGAFQFFHEEGHWTVGKAFDTFCPLGPYIDTEFDYNNARIIARLNGKELQNSTMEQIITPIHEMISYISGFMTLMPGDVILTGTPAGADFMRAGDTIECIVDGLGTLSNTVQQR